MMNAHEIFKSLEGKWKIHRIVNNKGVMHGEATFTNKHADELFYREDGIFIDKNNFKTFKVFRENLFCYAENTIKIYLIENNQPAALLHKLDFIDACCNAHSAQATSQHLCKNDTYNVIYSFAADSIHSQYNVEGPSKNYQMTTQFTRFNF